MLSTEITTGKLRWKWINISWKWVYLYFANQLSVSFEVSVGVNEAMLNVIYGLTVSRLGDEECRWGAFKHIKEHQSGSHCWKLNPILNAAAELAQADQILHGNCITSFLTTYNSVLSQFLELISIRSAPLLFASKIATNRTRTFCKICYNLICHWKREWDWTDQLWK